MWFCPQGHATSLCTAWYIDDQLTHISKTLLLTHTRKTITGNESGGFHRFPSSLAHHDDMVNKKRVDDNMHLVDAIQLTDIYSLHLCYKSNYWNKDLLFLSCFWKKTSKEICNNVVQLKMEVISVMAKLNFRYFCVTWPFRNYGNIQIYCSKTFKKCK